MKCACDEWNVFRPLLKRRRVDAHDVDAVVEILAELAFSDELGQILMGGEDEAGAERDEPVAAQAAELHLLQDAEELDLGKEAQIADFIEEERAVGGLLEVAFAGGDGAGEGAFLVAEELGFDEGFWNGAAGDSDKGAVGAGAEVVNGAGDQFLTRAAFAGDEHGGVEIGHAAHKLIDALHAGAGADDAIAGGGVLDALLHIVQLLLEGGVFVARLSMVLRSRMDGGRRQ